MSAFERVAATVTDHSRVVIAVLLLVTVAVGAGAGSVGQTSDLSQFQSSTAEVEALNYVQSNFTTGEQNTTTVQVITRGENVLDRESLLAQLRFERDLRQNASINRTLVDQQPFVGVSNLVALAAIQGEELRRHRAALDRTAAGLAQALNRTGELQRQYYRLNQSRQRGQIDNATYRERANAIEGNLTRIRDQAVAALTGPPANLSRQQAGQFAELMDRTRNLTGQLAALESRHQRGQINESRYRQRRGELRAALDEVYRGIQAVLAPAAQRLQTQAGGTRGGQSAAMPPLSEQIAAVEAMNESQVDRALRGVLGANGSVMALQLMPSYYQPGDTAENATMLFVTQRSNGTSMQGMASDRLVAAQLQMQEYAVDRMGEDTYVFGSGIISHETTQSMTDSILIVGPLALLFVLLVLIVAYRDLLDILLGLAGILLVLVWTFGFMGWMGYDFNQIFIAVPVLLIGLGIDYAIHVFMRHREERARHDGEGVADGMRVALASVGVALTLVTATTVIGFLSNLISSVPPIRQFGVVSAFGIVAALVVFGGLVPALKVEIDGFLEARGWDRRKSAFGTGGGALGRVLAGGVTAARKAPWAVILLALLVSAGGAYGATQVDTSFSQSDFIAEDPPAWMDSLPEPFAPGEYRVKESLSFVDQYFGRETSQAVILIRGNVTAPGALEQVADARASLANRSVVAELPTGRADVTGPVTVMRSVAEQNESFAAVLAAADTDGDGVPDRNLTGVYDRFFEVAPTEAAGVVYRTDGGGYEALRLTAGLATTDGGQVTEQFRAVAANLEGETLTATATGQTVVFKVISDQLLQTVVESLIITLVAIFAFLMVTYRVTEGSALLGLVTLLPVALSVTWILGTMYVLGIPFNVLTGMITSLTVGLGVAYSIHVSERFSHELGQYDSTWAALEKTLVGTGGALLGSAATTVGGFGVLAFAILPPLKQFGVITGLTIVYAFLASVLVLPSLLVVWARHVGPGVTGTRREEAEGEAATGDR